MTQLSPRASLVETILQLGAYLRGAYLHILGSIKDNLLSHFLVFSNSYLLTPMGPYLRVEAYLSEIILGMGAYMREGLIESLQYKSFSGYSKQYCHIEYRSNQWILFSPELQMQIGSCFNNT